jgi:polycystin 1L2
MLPWYCRYIAWALCALSILVSIFFLWAYGIQFGDEKTRKWITSLIISFFASILVTQPIKVFITAMILSTLFKSPDTDVDDSEEDEEELDIDLLPDEEWLHSLTPVRKKDRSRMYRPPNMTSLEKAKLQRMKELKMSAILKDIFSYLFFLWILTVISYGNRDPNAYLMKETLVKTFVEGANSGQKFMNIKNSDNLWSWSNSTLIPGIQIGDWYIF